MRYLIIFVLCCSFILAQTVQLTPKISKLNDTFNALIKAQEDLKKSMETQTPEERGQTLLIMQANERNIGSMEHRVCDENKWQDVHYDRDKHKWVRNGQ